MTVEPIKWWSQVQRSMYHCATWEDHDQLIIGVCVKYNNDSHFAIEESGPNFRWNGTSPPTIVGVRKLHVQYLEERIILSSFVWVRY